ncbi:putative GTP-binding protein 6 [Daphnia carinata]|uniref:putative GTP-binding protein 6 n=1 Tax=Daphnia carinata TaxID=120202 RepID=UPI00257D4442|nr:putative GTP-binding protein 6 [Daphnia carinata]
MTPNLIRCGSVIFRMTRYTSNHNLRALLQSPRRTSLFVRSFTGDKIPEDDYFKLELCSEEDNQDNHDYKDLVHRMHLFPSIGNQVVIVQPFVKWGPKKNELTTPDLMLEEAKGLIDSLPNWKCIDAVKIPVESLEKKNVFGSGQFESLQKKIGKNPNISAVFVNVNLLRGIQRKELTTAFRVPVYDRYSIVLQIFKERAKTREAKLQVAFAEIPYLRSCLVGLQKGTKSDGRGYGTLVGDGESYYESKLHLLERRELKIKKELEKMHKKRSLLKYERKKREFPVVAIVGYTNSGKTTLIKSLTGDSNIQPRNALFATLDVTVHGFKLPCNLTVLLIDTVGFISNIPLNLIAAFKATLNDAIDADMIIHLQDASHPDKRNQIATVNDTLKQLNIDAAKIILQVENKIDSIKTENPPSSCLRISAKHGTGLDELVERIQSKLLDVTSRKLLRFMVPNGGTEYSWLHKEATVVNYSHPKDPQYLILDVLVTPAIFGKLRSNYPNIRMLNK